MKLRNFLKATLIIAGVAVGGYLVIREYKKQRKNIDDQEKRGREESERQGIDPDVEETETLESIMNNKKRAEDNNLVKQIYSEMHRDPQVDLDIIDLDKSLKAAEGLIYVKQEGDKLFFLVEIPRKGPGDFTSPGIGDYVRAFNGSRENGQEGAANYIYNNIVRFSNPPISRLVGVMVLGYRYAEQDKDAPRSYMMVEIPPVMYEKYKTDKHDGLTDFVWAVRDNIDTKDSIPVVEDLGDEDRVDVTVVDVMLCWKIGFGIQRRVGAGGLGINCKMAQQALKWLTDGENGFHVQKQSRAVQNNNKTVIYDHILFLDLHEEDEIRAYGSEVENGKSVVKSFPITYDD